MWISHGRLEGISGAEDAWSEKADRRLGDGAVQIILTQTTLTVRWHLFAPNWSSLYYLLEWLPAQTGICRLEYFAAGWFYEDFADVSQAIPRIRQLMDKSDVFLRSRVFIKPVDMNSTQVPGLLQDVLMKRDAPAEYGVDCAEDPETRSFRVIRIGERTPIAERWGMTPVCFPCMPGNDYDQLVSSIYPKVLQTGGSCCPGYSATEPAACAWCPRSPRWTFRSSEEKPHSGSGRAIHLMISIATGSQPAPASA